ncbi:MAG: alpha/beta fold hydrolase [Anaerolineaceae bacterium]|nr:alpha/beta fold hydrolase [Anaerolineaceae bacterium]
MNVLTIVLISIIGAAAAGFVYQTIATQRDKRRFPPPGKLVDIGGRRLHLNLMGESMDGPTVILEAGMASYSANWVWVQQELAKETQVIAYDRAGLGWSDPGTLPLDAAKSASELHTALRNAGCHAPYVLAGHSYGGLVVRMFADLYPDEVAGLVLVDGSHPDQWMSIPASRGGQTVERINRATAFLARFGVIRLFRLEKSYIEGLPLRQSAEMRAYLAQPEPWIVGADGLVAWRDISREQVNHARPLGNLPLMVISVTEQAVYADELTALQNELPNLSDSSQHITVEGATHYTLVSEKKYADIVSNAILKVVAETHQASLIAEAI